MKRLLSAISLTLILLLLNSSPASAEEIKFRWRGEVGYTAKGSLVYDPAGAGEKIEASGKGKIRALKSLTVSFFDPLGNHLATYKNVAGGKSKGQYFGLNYDRTSGKLFGTIDLGGESPGEIYLKGEVNGRISLYQVGSGYAEISLDRGTSKILVTEPGETSS